MKKINKITVEISRDDIVLLSLISGFLMGAAHLMPDEDRKQMFLQFSKKLLKFRDTLIKQL